MTHIKIRVHDDACDMLVIKVLRRSAKVCKAVCFETADQKYSKKYIEAVNTVMDHFGGKRVKFE